MTESPPRLLVIGIGQEWRGDDAAGLLAVRPLRLTTLPGVAVREVTGDLLGLLDLWQEVECVIVADAVAAPAPPGTIWRWLAHQEDVPAVLAGAASSHGWGLAETVALGRTLGRLPRYLVIYGIAGQSFERGRRPASAVVAAAQEVSRQILSEVERLVSGQG